MSKLKDPKDIQKMSGTVQKRLKRKKDKRAA
jgi:hypothetical protein